MKVIEVIGIVKTYVNETLVGMGALKGANCRIQSLTKSGSVNTVVFVWTDTEGENHTSEMLVVDGTNGTNGTDGTDGVSPTITVKTNTDDTYILTITDKNGSYDTPNLKGSDEVSDLTDVDLTNLANGCALIYNSTSTKWEAVALGTAARKDSTDSVTADSTDLVESGAVYNAIEDSAGNVSEAQYSAISSLFS